MSKSRHHQTQFLVQQRAAHGLCKDLGPDLMMIGRTTVPGSPRKTFFGVA